MKDFLQYLLSLIVDHPDEIKIEEKAFGENTLQYIVSANQEDIGKIIGKGGKIIQSIRNVVKILAVKENKQIRIEVG
ncbi:KH domain-containing protein [Candidatus Gottesmanbacteria bacterium]|nr:KH domain-containing protein [Candidatus Gottesmanbacteria bacterium]MBI5452087.1 KH domain-containing protein [Candidatus Gottesmanbacteria bacterium]